jgi:ribonuclease BN (tRNA processing enzyme)
MRLHILGSGSCIVNQEKTSSGYLVETDKNLFMVDTGTGTTESLRKTNYSTNDIDTIINTHRHPDHVSDLVPIIQDKVVRSSQENEPDIKLIGPEGHQNYLESRMHDEMRVSPSEVSEEFGFNLEVIDLDSKELEEIDLDFIRADHGPSGFECLSIKLKEGEDTIVFTGDTDFNEELIQFSANADIIVADCSRPDKKKVEGHMTPSECAKIAERANVGTLILSHLYPEAESSDVKEKASKIFKGRIIVAEDLITVQTQT